MKNYFLAVIELMLTVELSSASVSEPGMILEVCFKSEVNQPLNRDASFALSLSNLTTATPDSDFHFELTSSLLTIPTDFSGAYEMCVNVTVFDDEKVESNEIIAYDIIPLSELDSVEFKGDGSSLAFTILDNDGKI